MGRARLRRLDDARDNLVNEGVLNAIETHNTPVLFDWMVYAFSFQGIADAIADKRRTASQTAHGVDNSVGIGVTVAPPSQGSFHHRA